MRGPAAEKSMLIGSADERTAPIYRRPKYVAQIDSCSGIRPPMPDPSRMYPTTNGAVTCAAVAPTITSSAAAHRAKLNAALRDLRRYGQTSATPTGQIRFSLDGVLGVNAQSVPEYAIGAWLEWDGDW